MDIVNTLTRFYFDSLKSDGVLDMHYPELHALIGVEQPEKWHPEGDAYEHTMLVLENARVRHAGDELLQLGAICHDLGKALTPRKEWPKHYGHANRGLSPAWHLLTRLGVDKKTIECVLLLVKYHMHIHQADKMRPITYQKIREDIQQTAKEDYHKVVLSLSLLGVCDHYGRGGVDPLSFYELPWIFYKNLAY